MEELKAWMGKLLVRWGKSLAPNQPMHSASPRPLASAFDAAARDELEEMLGYERYVLSECGDAIRTAHGKSGPIRIVVKDAEPHELHISAQNTIGDTGASMVRKISPLVLTASYKCLDMVLEWTISQNGISCPFRFEDKIDILESNASLIYPDFLQSDAALRNVAVQLFKALTPYRNAITHNRWGTSAANGDLTFDFFRKKRHFHKRVPFETVLALADGIELIGTMLVHHSSDTNRLDTLRWLFDRVTTFHGEPTFNIQQPRYYMVVRQTVLPTSGSLTVDLDGIRTMVQKRAGNHPATYDLLVIAEAVPQSAMWMIPFAQIPAAASLTLDGNWDTFRQADRPDDS